MKSYASKRNLNGNVELKQCKDSGGTEAQLALYKNELLDGIEQFSSLLKTELRQQFKKQYIYLYRYARECYVYFRANGQTEKLLADWGPLPALAIHQ